MKRNNVRHSHGDTGHQTATDAGLGSTNIKAVIINRFKEWNETVLKELKEKHDGDDSQVGTLNKETASLKGDPSGPISRARN